MGVIFLVFINSGEGVSLEKSRFEKFICDPNVYGVNRLENRASVVPASKRGVYYINKYDSDKLVNLCGDYKFKWKYKDDGDDSFFLRDFDDSGWDSIDVPSMWQYRGYGTCTYPNVQYHFPFDPPYIRCENPVGLYRRTFNMNDTFGKTVLHFGGVDNAFEVYVNGSFAGLAKGSRNAAEFDISDLLVKGENLLAVKVATWSDASYLENQDMLLSNGIFRDVYLVNTEKISVRDYFIGTDLESITVSVDLSDFDESTGLCVTAAGKTEKKKVSAEKSEFYFKVDDPKTWTAEEPNLYDVYIELYEGERMLEVHSKRVGLVTSYCRGNKFYVNDRPVMLKGVNRHEHNCRDGKAVSIAQMENEVRILKASNVNAVRCSHYTDDPSFYELCTKYGLYLMDEADIESHGAEVTGDQGALAKMHEWEYAFLYRTKAMAQNNKNETCIVIWSIGNECGCGENIRKCAEYLRSLPISRPIHQSQDSPKAPEFDDFRKNGYCAFASMDEYPTEGAPVVLTEYAHGMGNAPGCLEDYWDYFYSHEQYCGGFIWEFKSHGFYAEDESGRSFSKYGGDFDKSETNHWQNFTLDGYLQSDLTPKPAMLELKEVLSPVRATLEDGKVYIRNTNDFRSLSYLTLDWQLLCDYTPVKCGRLAMPPIPARSTDVIPIDITVGDFVGGADYYIDLVFSDGENTVSHRQLRLENPIVKPQFVPQKEKLSIKADRDILTVSGKDFEVCFENGLVASYTKNNMPIITSPMTFCFFRALTDNDDFRRNGSSIWESARFPSYGFFADETAAKPTEFGAEISVRGKTTAQGQFAGFDWEIDYKVFADGLILFDMKASPYGRLPEKLLRIGVVFELDKAFGNVEWYGRGKQENYSDRKLSCPMGYYAADVKDLNFRYEMPQECGTRTDNRFVRVSSDVSSLGVVGSDSFIFSYHDFTLENLNNARHKNELVTTCDKNYLHIDYAMRGLGNHSCGPDPEERYELHPHAFEFAFALCAGADSNTLLELSRKDFGRLSLHAIRDYALA